jgi:translocator protein
MYLKNMKQTIRLRNGNQIRLSWWQIALASIVVSGLSRLMAAKSSKKSQKFYSRQLKQSPWAPPGWLFGPAWTFNNFFLLWALIRIVKMESSPAKTKLLVMQIAIWMIFYSFDFVYFRKKSPLLAAIWTKTDAALAIASMMTAYKTDRELAACYLPLVVWTSYASTVADYQALYNPDPVFNTPRLLH